MSDTVRDTTAEAPESEGRAATSRPDPEEAATNPPDAGAAPTSDGSGPEATAAPTSDSPQSAAAQPGSPRDSAPAIRPEPTARKEIRLRLFGRTDVGQVRDHNEDNFIVADLTKKSRGLMEAERTQLVGERGCLLGVCDGMGGAAAGEVASQLAVDIIYQRMLAGDTPVDRNDLAARLVHAIESAGQRIFGEAKLDRTRRGMGTTATIATLLDDHLFLGQVGDSRAYILRAERLVQVTRDQSLVNQLIEAGQLTEEEAETYEHANIILQALGTADSVQVDLTHVSLCKGDTLLLCSDGLSGMVHNDEIRDVLQTHDEPLEACKVLTDRANQAGGHDNITVLVAKFEGAGLAEPTQETIGGLKYEKYALPEPPSATDPPPAEPKSRGREGDPRRASARPAARRFDSGAPEITVHDDGDGGNDDGDGDVDSVRPQGEEPIHLPTEGAPSWLVTMMIVSALACVFIAGYYLLH